MLCLTMGFNDLVFGYELMLFGGDFGNIYYFSTYRKFINVLSSQFLLR